MLPAVRHGAVRDPVVATMWPCPPASSPRVQVVTPPTGNPPLGASQFPLTG